MTNSEDKITKYSTFSTSELAAMINSSEENIKNQRKEIEVMKFILLKHMEANKSSVIPDEIFDIKLEKKTSGYDYAKLAPLKEVLTHGDLEKSYKPATMKTIEVPEEWDGRVLKGFYKYGNENGIVDILNNAKIPDRVTGVSVTLKK